MVDVTWTNGQSLAIDGGTIVRIRASVAGIDQPGSNTRIDGHVTNYVLEQPHSVAAAARLELSTLVELNQPSGRSVWLDARKIIGPVFVSPELRTDGIRSSVKIGSAIQYLSNEPEQVAAAITGAGGKPEPIRQDRPLSDGTPFLQVLAL